MKKYFLTMAVMAIFAIGFAASDEESPSNSPSSSPSETQQVKEKSTEEIRQEKVQKVLKSARRWGNACPVSMYSKAKEDCKRNYISSFGTPSSDEDFEMYKIYEEEFMKVWSEKRDAMKRMDNM
jgi:hypothetical protein